MNQNYFFNAHFDPLCLQSRFPFNEDVLNTSTTNIHQYNAFATKISGGEIGLNQQNAFSGNESCFVTRTKDDRGGGETIESAVSQVELSDKNVDVGEKVAIEAGNVKQVPSFFLSLFLDGELLNKLLAIVNCRNKLSLNVSKDEICCFVAILYISGYIDVPRRRMLWERSPDTHCALVSRALQRDRFEAILTCLHSGSDSENLQNLLAIIEILNKKFLEHYLPDNQHNIAECSVHHHAKLQNVRNTAKLLKMWCACTKIGYCTSFKLLNLAEASMAQSVVLNYVKQVKPVELVVEKSYYDPKLAGDLQQLGVRCVEAEREKGNCTFNSLLGGIDRLEANLALYRTSTRGKKPLSIYLTFCLDLALNNAWILYKAASTNKKTSDLLSFRRNIVVYYLERYAKPISNKGSRPAKLYRKLNKRSLSEARYDGVRHYVIPQEKQTRCANCSAKTTTRCQKCDVGVHVKCFVDFHTAPKIASAKNENT